MRHTCVKNRIGTAGRIVGNFPGADRKNTVQSGNRGQYGVFSANKVEFNIGVSDLEIVPNFDVFHSYFGIRQIDCLIDDAVVILHAVRKGEVDTALFRKIKVNIGIQNIGRIPGGIGKVICPERPGRECSRPIKSPRQTAGTAPIAIKADRDGFGGGTGDEARVLRIQCLPLHVSGIAIRRKIKSIPLPADHKRAFSGGKSSGGKTDCRDAATVVRWAAQKFSGVGGTALIGGIQTIRMGENVVLQAGFDLPLQQKVMRSV